MRPNIGEQVDQTMMLLIGVCFAFLAIVAIAMFYFVYKYNSKRHKTTEDIHGNTPLEIIWTVVPTIIVLVLFFYGWKGFENMRDIPEDSMPVKVTAQMWKWNFEYENGKKTDTMYVPANKNIRVNLFSIDVNHAFYVPSYRVKEDAVPGRENRLWFQALGPDSLVITCAEYCGLDHSIMLTKLIVMPEEEFWAWYNTPDAPADTTNTTGDTTKVPVSSDTTSGQTTGQDTNINKDTTK